jgi:hypothetical protein
MVRPYGFGFNQETGQDNEFQHQPNCSADELQSKALLEFDAMVTKLQGNGLEVLVLDEPAATELPDAVFPNNWFSTSASNELIIYPMKTPNRRAEVRIAALLKLLKQHHYQVSEVHDLRPQTDLHANWQAEHILEGTGSLVFNHPTGHIYCALSERAHLSAVNRYCERFNYQATCFNSKSSSGNPIYHTNVLLSCGTDLAVVCLEAVAEEDQQALKAQLNEHYQTIIEISEQQMTHGFCGNVLELHTTSGEPVLVLSQSATEQFNSKQIKQLESFFRLIPCAIPTIEYIGGGSARCMIAENFLSKQQKHLTS